MFQNIGPMDWLIIIALVLIFFRADRVGEIARQLGRSISEFKKGMREGEDELKKTPGDNDKTSPQ